MTGLSAAQANPGDPAAMQQLGRTQGALTSALGRFTAVAEAYPDLKANQNMMQLSEELTSTENRVAFARQAYNDSVMSYNNRRETFPGSVIAGMFHFEPAALWEIAPEHARDARGAEGAVLSGPDQAGSDGLLRAAARMPRGTTLRLVVLFALAVVAIVAVDRPASSFDRSARNAAGASIIGCADRRRRRRDAARSSAGARCTKMIALRARRRGGRAVGRRGAGRPDAPPIRGCAGFVNVVEEMSIASGVPVPRLFVLEQEAGINAFAAGYTPADAAIAVTARRAATGSTATSCRA